LRTQLDRNDNTGLIPALTMQSKHVNFEK